MPRAVRNEGRQQNRADSLLHETREQHTEQWNNQQQDKQLPKLDTNIKREKR